MTRFLGMSTAHSAMLLAWAVYLILALSLSFYDALPYAIFTVLCVSIYLLKYFEDSIPVPATPALACHACLAVLGALALVIIAWQIATAPGELRLFKVQSVIGFCALVGFSFLTSHKRSNIPWRLVAAGLLCQFYLGVFVFKSRTGYKIFESMGDAVSTFLNFADVGAMFVFQDSDKTFAANHIFAFSVLPKTVFFSAVCSIMYYLGVLQATVRVVAAVLRFALGSSTVESVNAAGNIFLGQTEAPLLVRNILPSATPSEIHCIMTGGFATVAGGVLAAYIAMGVSPSQLIGASVMSAPAALTISKIVCPSGVTVEKPSDNKGLITASDSDVEDDASDATGDTTATAEDTEFVFPAPSEKNIVEAAANGSSIAIALVLNIAAMLISFLSLIAFLDTVLLKLGAMVRITLSFEVVCGWLFFPVAWIIGTPYEDCGTVASLIGTKIFLNEFVAYQKLSTMIGVHRAISPRGELIATYSLCGFSNVASIGVQVGGLAALCPEKKYVYVSLVVSAMIAGNTCCLMTAAVAGILS
ncbi:unnamed protein product [Prorocentrum cordatum]|uniref:Sodium/nucleoside cotransporter n=1 Tax=Prorocentrum cordatum TaxID=2364126 RepID=A0ABN9XKW3_9DINO|nr:unnamed protein product [Polarella glacialis]